MWLPMHMDTSRNLTYNKVLQGKYKNIRLRSMAHNNQPDGGFNGTSIEWSIECTAAQRVTDTSKH